MWGMGVLLCCFGFGHRRTFSPAYEAHREARKSIGQRNKPCAIGGKRVAKPVTDCRVDVVAMLRWTVFLRRTRARIAFGATRRRNPRQKSFANHHAKDDRRPAMPAVGRDRKLMLTEIPLFPCLSARGCRCRGSAMPCRINEVTIVLPWAIDVALMSRV